MIEETRDQPDKRLQIATRLGFINKDQVSRIVQKANADSIDCLDAARDLDLLRAVQCHIIEHLLHPNELAPGYCIRDLIGYGGNGIVFRATQTRLGRDVALKTINTTTQSGGIVGERMRREAQSIASLQHPNIVAAYDCGFHQGNFHIAMELVDGEDLASYCRRAGKLDEATTWWIARQVASALSHAHQSGIIHRDIKPANILLTEVPEGSAIPDGVPFAKVADFGLAFHSKLPADSNITEPGTTLGTPAFVAPEQLSDTHVDHRADIYSLGATIYQMLQSAAPYQGKSAMKVIVAKTIGKDEWRDELWFEMSAPTTQLFRDMTETDPERRVDSYRDLLSRIDEVLSGLAEPVGFVEQVLTYDREVDPHFDTVEYSHGQENTVTATTVLPQTKSPGLSRARMLLLAVAGLAVLAFAGNAIIHRAQFSGAKAAELNSVAQRWRLTGAPEYFFNGRSLPVRLSKFGSWSPAQGPEGESVLRGMEGAWMDLPMEVKSGASDLRVMVAVAIPDGGEVDLHLPNDAADPRRLVRITASGASVLVEETGRILPRSKEIQFRQDPDGNSFHDCHFLAVEGMLVVFVDGKLLGHVAYAAREGDALRIGTRKGSADFADLRISEVQERTQVP